MYCKKYLKTFKTKKALKTLIMRSFGTNPTGGKWCQLHGFAFLSSLFNRGVKYDCRPRWLSWMCHPTGDQEVAGSAPAEVGNILPWRLIMKYFLVIYGHSLPSADSRRAVVSFWQKNVHNTVNRLED